MRERCNCPTHAAYEKYGGRGIKVCARWDSVEAFIEDMGPRPDGYSLERKDNDGPYSPENCKWASALEQSNNNRNCRVVEYKGIKLNVTQWANKIGVPRSTLYHRLNAGLSVQRVLREYHG
jgi:hypothetical protein